MFNHCPRSFSCPWIAVFELGKLIEERSSSYDVKFKHCSQLVGFSVKL